jgi:hypothetical protein
MIAAPPRQLNTPATMKTIVISLSLLLLLLACGKLPEDPKLPRKPVLPGTMAVLPASPFHEGDGAGLFGSRSAGAHRKSAVRSM